MKRLIDMVYETLNELKGFQLMGMDQQAAWAMSITSQVIAGPEGDINEQVLKIAKENGLL